MLIRLFIFSLLLIITSGGGVGCGDVQSTATTTTTTASTTTSTTTTTTATINITLLTYAVKYTSNGDTLINRGEQIVLDLSLKNSGTGRTGEVYATLNASDSNIVTIEPSGTYGSYAVQNPLNFGTLEAGSTESTSNLGKYFGFTLSNNCPVDRTLDFSLALVPSAGGSWSASFPLTVEATRANLGYGDDYTFTNEALDTKMKPGDRISFYPKIKNWGSARTDGVTVVLSTLDPYLTMSAGGNQASFGTLNATAEAVSAAPFLFTVGAAAPASREANLNFYLFDQYGNTWSSNEVVIMLNGIGAAFTYVASTFYKYSGTDNGKINPGDIINLKVSIQNNGSNPTHGTVAGTLGETDAYVSLLTGYETTTFPQLPISAVASGDAYFRFVVLETCPTDHVINFTLALSAESYGFSLPFIQTVEAK